MYFALLGLLFFLFLVRRNCNCCEVLDDTFRVHSFSSTRFSAVDSTKTSINVLEIISLRFQLQVTKKQGRGIASSALRPGKSERPSKPDELQEIAGFIPPNLPTNKIYINSGSARHSKNSKFKPVCHGYELFLLRKSLI